MYRCTDDFVYRCIGVPVYRFTGALFLGIPRMHGIDIVSRASKVGHAQHGDARSNAAYTPPSCIFDCDAPARGPRVSARKFFGRPFWAPLCVQVANLYYSCYYYYYYYYHDSCRDAFLASNVTSIDWMKERFFIFDKIVTQFGSKLNPPPHQKLNKWLAKVLRKCIRSPPRGHQARTARPRVCGRTPSCKKRRCS